MITFDRFEMRNSLLKEKDCLKGLTELLDENELLLFFFFVSFTLW